jgi:tRNA-specific 2-thiouridylase
VALGFDAVATGHYARIVPTPEGPQLHRAVDRTKDQSYVLGVLTADQLARAMFPLGDSTKQRVREEAERRGLAVARKPDSHDVCFIPDGDTAGFLRRRIGAAPGPIVDSDGAVLGSHDGAFAYTVGQRKGLGLGVPAADGRPRYVLDVSPVDRTVTVGPRESLAVGRAEGIRPRWCVNPPVGRLRCTAQVRAHGTPVPASAVLDGNRLHVTFETPVEGLAAGQAVVLYDGDRVVGSATVERTAPVGA